MFRKILLCLVAVTVVGVCTDFCPTITAAVESVVGALTEGGAIGPGGVEVACDLPMACRKANIASKGLGCCVFRSIDHSAHYQNVPTLYGMPEWMKEVGIEGGGYPAKVDALIPKIAQTRGEQTPEYIQHTAGDLEFLYAAIKSGRMPAITYCGRDMHYGAGRSVAHMVNLVHLDPPESNPRLAAILDNNFIGESELVWMTAAEFMQRWKGNSGGWAVVLKAPRPPAPPRNG